MISYIYFSSSLCVLYYKNQPQTLLPDTRYYIWKTRARHTLIHVGIMHFLVTVFDYITRSAFVLHLAILAKNKTPTQNSHHIHISYFADLSTACIF